MTTRGGWLPRTLGLVGVVLVALALVNMARRHFGEGLLDSISYNWPVLIVMLVLGVVLIALSRR